jgi:hypothetical protein
MRLNHLYSHTKAKDYIVSNSTLILNNNTLIFVDNSDICLYSFRNENLSLLDRIDE